MEKAMDFLPISMADMKARGWSECDFVFVSGDAYVDHPSFAAALLGRLLESKGYKVGIIAQPDYKNVEAFKVLGRPRLAFLVSAGAMDSMVSNYTANNKPRSEDAYAHGGEAGHRPDRALITYVAKIKEAYKGVDVIVGGIEASLRRFSHYDYWSNKVRRSILLDCKADLLMYGMGEHSMVEIANQLNCGKRAREIRNVRGTCWWASNAELTGKKKGDGDAQGKNSQGNLENENGLGVEEFVLRETHGILEEDVAKKVIEMPSFEEISVDSGESKRKFAESFVIQEQNTDAINADFLVEKSDSRFVVQNIPSLPLTTAEFDQVMELPYTRRWHPVYDTPASNGKTGVPGLKEVLFSLTSVRGCFGACSFCAITFHQGRRIQARSHESLVKEAENLTKHPEFKGYIHDVGGPTANFRQPACKKQIEAGVCKNRQCLGTNPCPNLDVNHQDYVSLLEKLRKVPGVKKVFIRSGIRFDYLVMDKDKHFLEDLCRYHISGQLKVAPENSNDKMLQLMRKSNHATYEKFEKEYADMNKKLGLKQYLVPYYIVAHPGSSLKEAIDTALYLKKTGFVPDQIQDFYPTPGSLSTCQYYTELDPYTKNADGSFKHIYVAKGARERRLQRAVIQFNKPENRPLVKEALEKAGRQDLLKVLYSRK
ncbi:MAG: YgiQ family radical SAM protein [Treponema sp.]|nr:YgiQ family radical SAM protein [Treponema sp.]